MYLKNIAEQLRLISIGDLPYRSTDEDKIALLREETITLDLIISRARHLRDECLREAESLEEMVALTKQGLAS